MNDNLEDTKPRPVVSLPPEAPKEPTPPPGTYAAPAGVRPSTSPATPRQPVRPARPDIEPPSGPPRWLFWGVIAAFVLGMLAVVGSVAAFRFVLEPAQQERVMQALPFMEAFLPPRPKPGDVLPTPESASNDVSPEDLLNGLSLSGTATPEAEATTDAAAEATVEPTLEPTDAPQATATLAPTEEPTAQPTSEPTESSEVAPTAQAESVQAEPTAAVEMVSQSPIIPRTVRLTGFNYQKQTWNNCGPANVTMALSYYGWEQDQTYAADFLKPGGREDKNVNPAEMAAFVNEQSAVDAVWRVGGTVDLIKQLLANNIPVIVETGSMPEGYDWLGHYRTMVGYDDNQGVFTILDSFVGSDNPGAGILESYPNFDDDWKQFNRTFIVVYEPQRAELVERIMGDYMDEQAAAQIALEQATAEATADTTDGHAWFNMGSSLSMLGDYERAALAFDKARVEGIPWRMTWYQFGPFEAYLQSGRVNEVISLVETNLGNGGEYVEETYYWQGRALEAQGLSNEAASAYRSALSRNPRYTAAREALDSLGA
jgi:tetratricopeptide (TPR) repeat protein